MTAHETYMRTALEAAREAARLGEIPVGACIVRDGEILSVGYNTRESERDPLGHAEINAIRQACQRLGSWRLDGCVLYVTLEPCPMCAGAIVQARIPKVVIGCMNPKAGCAGSVLDLLHEEGFNHQAETEVGTLGEECSSMLKEFFRELRVKGKEKKRLLREEAAEAEGREKQEPTG